MKKRLQIFLSAIFLSSSISLNAQTYTFTNANAEGRYGPSQTDIDDAYQATSLEGDVTINTLGIQEWVVPTSGTYKITAIGACGGEEQGDYYPGKPGTGATIKGDFSLTQGTVVYIVVGQKGKYDNNGSGGGGGSFAFTGNPAGNGLLIAAGGGGGWGHGDGGDEGDEGDEGVYTSGALGAGGSATTAATASGFGNGDGGSKGIGEGGKGGGPLEEGECEYGAGSGGAGWLSDGEMSNCDENSTGGNHLTFEGGNSTNESVGGFGGGGGSTGDGTAGGGGGGYSGGGGGNGYNGFIWGAGGGGGSFNAGINQVNTAGETGALSGYTHGSVVIEYLGLTSIKKYKSSIAVNAYPNPTKGAFTLNASKSFKEAEIKIHTILGEVIYSEIFSGNNFSYNLDGLTSGMYFIEVVQNGEVSRTKIVKD